MTEEEFVKWARAIHSWAFWIGSDLVGILLFEPVTWPGFHYPTDGYMTFGLARRVWGEGVLEEAKTFICEAIFGHWPTVQRITGYTLRRNVAAQHSVERLGGTWEGTLHDACGAGEDIEVYGLTRKNYYGRTNHYPTDSTDR